MFTDLPQVEPATADLFATPCSERLRTLMSRPRRVAWAYRAPDTSTFRYRVANMVEALNSDPDSPISAAWFADPDLASLEPLVPHLDALVVARYPAGPAIMRLLSLARHHGVPVVWDCDDLVFDPALAPMLMDAVAQDLGDPRNWELWFAYTSRLQATMRRCGSAITTVEPLRMHLLPHFESGEVAVLPNFLARDQQEISAKLLQAKRDTAWRRDELVTVGYFSGTPTHARDFDVVAPALRRLLEKDDGVRLRLVGRLVVPSQLAGLGERIDLVPFTDPLSLQRLIAEVEVNLVPLQHHTFTACKSELKFFEAAAVGTWTIASDTPALCSAIDDGRTGRLARAHEWEAALSEAVSMARSGAPYVERVEEAATDVFGRYGWDRHTPQILDALDRAAGVITRSGEPSS